MGASVSKHYFSDLDWIELQFTDLVGSLHGVAVNSRDFNKNLEKGFVKLDGSSIKGFSPIEYSDLLLKPIIKTLAKIPWHEKVARVLSAIYDPYSGKRFSKDPRYVVEKLEAFLENNGLRALVGVEIEFFVFDEIGYNATSYGQDLKIVSMEAHDGIRVPVKSGYYVVEPYDRFAGYRLALSRILREYFNVFVKNHHHEVASAGQIEVNIEASTPLTISDHIQTTKYVAKNIAVQQGKVAVFLPKPVMGDNGSGMHIHLSLWNNSHNLFYDENDRYAHLSQLARYFIGGLIEHGRSLSALVSPTVNSYRRLIPGYEAPIYLTWGKSNRSAAIRIPASLTKTSKRIEYRPPDPLSNPYLAIPAIVLAGIDGINKKIDPGDPVDINVYKLSKSKRRELGIIELPRSLEEALDELESDNEYLKPIFNNDLLESYIEVKRKESRLLQGIPSPSEFVYYSII